MSTIQQICPSCERLLELPAAAQGRLAKCPACDATFTASDETAAREEPEPPGDEQAPDVSPYGAPQAKPPLGRSDTAEEPDPSDPDSANPFSAPLAAGSVADDPATRWNPYEPMLAVDPVDSVGDLRIAACRIEDVLSRTLSIFGNRWGALVLAFLLVFAATAAVIIGPGAILAELADSGATVLATIGTVIGVALLYLFLCCVAVGLIRNALAVARNAPSPIMELFPPLNLVVRFLVVASVLSLITAITAGLFLGLISAIAASGADGLAGLLGITGTIGAMGIGLIALWWLWSWMFVVSDGKATAKGSIKTAITITRHNKMSSALMILIAVVVQLAGVAACYVGILVTQPLTILMLTVAYLMMTDQPTAGPTAAVQPTYPTPPSKPTF